MKDLIEKYFDGETSLEEEQRLLEYFNAGKVADELKQYTPFFIYIKREKQNSLAEDFDEKLLQKLEEKPTAKLLNMRQWMAPALKAAAIGTMLLAAYLFLKPGTAPTTQQHAINWDKYEIKDEQLAYEETVKALRLVSSKLNRASQKTIKEVAKTESLAKYLN